MALSKYTILVIDYIPTDMMLFKILLEHANCNLLTADNGLHALEIIREKHPDLILLDVYLPGIGGFELAEILQKEMKTRHIPLLYVANIGDYPILKPDGSILSEKECIEKPFDIKKLVKKILQRMERH